ncbi:2-amino-4-hydroxy-6-hydroxymethyldihydropteridine diphosphokinase [Chitinophaga horti]|uniref:2-amino-4-hydroxy-6-hydroxymethyldihydropteridine pyrophosphokinase n=1 Tax=Chitinophaga horti TaxID=2920382 RepID=A0ABY6IUJ2_9BACT|nr:2-amino-4-hydroxy-6-hydroxymethyldihydropteridine diphosphokinase [Chitinophaga horti]UYQ91041.1 2-amino-4-hydroxy-6-hydroxymethyldihydropteridine diphosphokinase [Chitinophaga horti]
MNTAILLIGGNLGNRSQNLRKAVDLLDSTAGKVVRASSLYATAPWGGVKQPNYLNQALELQTPLTATALLELMMDIERQIGRVRREKWGSRVIDIDMIFFNNDVIDLPQLKVPHPQMANRRFVLTPLCEMMPAFVHPVLQQPLSYLLSICPDPLPVHKRQPSLSK